jgi:HEAT repeat protein
MYVDCVENKVLDYSAILNGCGIGSESPSTVLTNIIRLEEFYNAEELISIYNYFLLNIENFEIRTQIVKLTDSYRNESTLAILLKLLQTENTESSDDTESLINLKAMCAKAIANYKDNSTVITLLDCLNNKKEHYKVRLACADALGRIGDRYAVKPLLDLVEDDDEKSVYLKESATFALGLLGDTSVIDPLVAILESKQGF